MPNIQEDASKAPEFPVVPVLLVDGDIVAYRCAAAAEKVKYLVWQADHERAIFCDSAKDANEICGTEGFDTVWSRKVVEPVENAVTNTQHLMRSIAEKFKDSVVKVYLSGEKNFRDNVWVTKKYKGNRDQPKPKHLGAVQSYLKEFWHAEVTNGTEADDAIGIQSGDDTVIASTDKDLDQIPGWHYNFVSGDIYYVTPEDAEQYLWEQVISGDQVDNIPGLPGWGPVKARKYLDLSSDRDLGDATLQLYEQEGFDDDYFREQFALIYILRQPLV